MKKYHIDSFKNGWVVGDFLPSIFRTKDVEVAVMNFKADAQTQDHYHAKAIEINIIVKGWMRVNGEITFREGDIFVLNPYEVSHSEFLADTTLVVIKVPSVPGDKHEV